MAKGWQFRSRIPEAVRVMQMVGIDYMIENGMQADLLRKGILTEEELQKIEEKSNES